MELQVQWSSVRGFGSHLWQRTRVLYAYLHPVSEEILYLGKADGCSVRARFTAADKRGFFDWLGDAYELDRERVHVLVGTIYYAGRLTRELVADAESLLIHAVQPAGNLQCRRDRIRRPGLRVLCEGRWPLEVSGFVDA